MSRKELPLEPEPTSTARNMPLDEGRGAPRQRDASASEGPLRFSLGHLPRFPDKIR